MQIAIWLHPYLESFNFFTFKQLISLFLKELRERCHIFLKFLLAWVDLQRHES